MSYVRFLARLAAFAVASVYAVVTVTFLIINSVVLLPMKRQAALTEWGGASEERLEAIRQGYIQARDLDVPFHERYVGWLVDVTTLDWGYSFAYRQAVIAVLNGRVQATLGYVIPGVAVAVVLGVALGLFAALSKDSGFDWSARIAAYALFGVPVFMFVYYLHYLEEANSAVPALGRHALTTLAVAVSLLAGQVRFARASALKQTGEAFVKMLRAKGADRLLLARHVLRNAAIPIVSLSMTELLAVLVLNIYVIEAVVGIDGLARASLRAIRASDTALVI